MTTAPAILFAMADQPRHPDLANLQAVDGVPLATVPIAPASFLLGCADGQTLAVRYMGASDVLHSIRQKQLDAYLLGLKERSPWAYLLIGGQMTPDRDGRVRHGDTATGWAWDAYQGALLSAQEIGVGVLTLAHADSVGDALARLARRERGPKRVRPTRDALWSDPGAELLMALPGIGEALADQILTACANDVGAALLALTDDNTVLPGVGPKTREAARRVLGGVVGPLSARGAGQKAA